MQPVPSRRYAIADDIRNQISTGRIKAGVCLPSEAQLASRYTVSTATLRSALSLLQGEGLVEKIHGKGNFVRYPSAESRTWAVAAHHGRSPRPNRRYASASAPPTSRRAVN